MRPTADRTPQTPVLILTGPVGVGKTTVGWEALALLARQGVAAAFVDVDALGACYVQGRADRFNLQISLRNLASVWRNYEQIGVRSLVASVVLESRADLRPIREAVPDASFYVVRLRASVATLLQRLERREHGSAQAWHLDRARVLAAEMETQAIEDAVLETEGVQVIDVAHAALVAAGWLT